MRRKILICFLFNLVFFGGILSPSVSSAAAMVTDVEAISSLPFDKAHRQTGLAIAQDEKGNTWFKGDFSADLVGHPLIFHIPSSHIIDYELYVYQDGHLLAVEKNIDHNQREVKSRFPTHFFTASHPEYYLNIKNQAANTLKVEIKELQQFMQSESVSLMRNSLYYGLIIMAILFNIILYLIFGDRRFASYSLLQLSLFSIFLYEDGMLYYFSNGEWALRYFLIWAISFCATFGGIFAYYLLDLKLEAPHFKKIAVPIVVGIFSSVLIYTWTDILLFRHLATVLTSLLPAICYYQALKIFWDKVYMRVLLISIGLLVVVANSYIFNTYFNSAFLSYFGINTLRLASTIEIITIACVFSFKIRTLSDKKRHYKMELQQKQELALVQTNQFSFPIRSEDGHQSMHSMLEKIGGHYNLTLREMEVLNYIWEGDSYKEISEKLCISVNTTKFHISGLYTKLGVSSRSEARSLREVMDT